MKTSLAKPIASFIDSGWNASTSEDFMTWRRRLIAFLRSTGEETLVVDLSQYNDPKESIYWEKVRDGYVSHLEGQLHLAQEPAVETSSAATPPAVAAGHQALHKPAVTLSSNRVFIVHGHDESAKEATARFVEKLGLEAVVLHERPSQGQTVIEKFENYSDVGFAVVLLTPDDVGTSAATPDKLQGRARQNVILELGFFTGKLGRRFVCGLFRPGLEIPSDFHGVLLIEMDPQGAWRTKLAQELVSVGAKIDLQGLLQT